MRSSIALTIAAHPGVLLESYEYSIGAVEPLGRHLHPSWQLAWSPDACGEHWVRGMTRQAPPRAISISRPGDVHAPSQQRWVDAKSRYMMAYVEEATLREFTVDLQAGPNGTPSFRSGVIENDSALSALYARAHRLSFGSEPLARDSAWLAFFTRLLTRHATPVFSLPRPAREPRAVQLALACYRRMHTSCGCGSNKPNTCS